MHFGKTMERTVNDDWRIYSVNYKLLKKRLSADSKSKLNSNDDENEEEKVNEITNTTKENVLTNSSENMEERQQQRQDKGTKKLSDDDELVATYYPSFWKFFSQCLLVIETFHHQKMEWVVQRLKKSESSVERHRQIAVVKSSSLNSLVNLHEDAIDSLPNVRDALDAFADEVDTLMEFYQLNYTAISKILKKYDKRTGSSVRDSKLEEVRADIEHHRREHRDKKKKENDDRLLRAARRYVQDHVGDDEKDSTKKTKKKHHHSSKSSRRRTIKEEEGEEDIQNEVRNDDDREKRESAHRRRHDRSSHHHEHRTKSKESRGRRARSGRRRSDDDDDQDSASDRRRRSKKRHRKKSERKDGGDRKRHHRDTERRGSKPRNGKQRSRSSSSSSSRRRRRRRRPSHGNLPIHNADLFPIGPIATAPPTSPIDPDKDYFSFHPKLRLYLYRTRGIYFEDLNAKETRSAFATFCTEYNHGRLEEAYYYNDVNQIPPEALQQCKRTRHVWNFNTNHTEQKSLDLIKAGVRKQTEYDVKVTTPRRQSHQCRKVIIPPRTIESIQRGKDQENPSGANEVNEERAVLKLIGLDNIKSGQKLTIAPREDS